VHSDSNDRETVHFLTVFRNQITRYCVTRNFADDE
jgi:hypothetical protein